MPVQFQLDAVNCVNVSGSGNPDDGNPDDLD